MKKTYKLIQVGYGIFGVGDTRELAIIDACEWLDGENGKYTPEQVEIELSEFENQNVHGSLQIIIE
jgi:hypothetical protein